MSVPQAGQPLLGDRYELGERLGGGGMAEVYLAHDRALGRAVAVKVLNPEHAADATWRERFRREAQAAARLNHPNIVAVYDWGAPGPAAAPGRHPFDRFIVMEYVPGGNLGDLVTRRGPLPELEALGIAAQIASALDAAHRQGVIHRDIKPQNVLLSADGQVKVADFGIARVAGVAPITRTAEALGTAEFLSPEQAQGKPADARSDLYSLGILLYQLLTGRVPFAGDTAVAVAMRQVRDRPEPPRRLRPAISPRAEAIVLRLLAKDPLRRYQSAAALRLALLEASGQVADRPEGTLPAPTPVTKPAASPRRGPGAAGVPLGRRPQSAAPPRQPDRNGRLLALALALALLVGAIVGLERLRALGPGGTPVRGMAAAPPTPVPSPVAAVGPALAPPAAASTRVVAIPSPQPTSAPTERPTLVPAAGPTSAPAPTATPGAAAGPAPPAPTLAPSVVAVRTATTGATSLALATPPTPAAGALDPVQTVIRFYTLIGERQFALAAQLWSPAMQAAYPPASNIAGRFAGVQQMLVKQATLTANGQGRATVAVDVVETDAGSPPVSREFVGDWLLVAGTNGWLLDRPDLRQAR